MHVIRALSIRHTMSLINSRDGQAGALAPDQRAVWPQTAQEGHNLQLNHNTTAQPLLELTLSPSQNGDGSPKEESGPPCQGIRTSVLLRSQG